MSTEPEKPKAESQSLSRDTKVLVATIVTSAIAVVGIVVALAQISNSNIAELRADMRSLRVETRTELREMRNILLQHVQGHSHSPQTTNPAGANAEPTEMTFLHSDSHPSKTTSVAYFAAPWPGKSSDHFVPSSEVNASL